MSVSMFYYWADAGKCSTSGMPIIKQARAEGCAMPDCYFKGRPVYFGNVYVDGVDSYFEDATYADTGVDLDEDELYALGDQEADHLIQQNMESRGWYK